MAEPTKTESELDDNRAYALMQSALSLIPKGFWVEASQSLEEAAALHKQAHRAYDEARCLQLAATLRRSSGNLAEAKDLADRAAASAPQDLPLSISILCEQAETAYVEERFEDAVQLWSTALNQANVVGLGADGVSAILRRRASAYLYLNQMENSSHDFEEAFHVTEAEHGCQTALWVILEQAALLSENGLIEEANHLIRKIDESTANLSSDPYLIAETRTLQARQARYNNDAETAIKFAKTAREAALTAIAPLTYFKASVELSEALDLQEDHIGTYGTLATAWGTLSDVIGRDVAQSWIEPCLLGFKLRWGDAVFQEAKSAYEARRRIEISHGK